MLLGVYAYGNPTGSRCRSDRFHAEDFAPFGPFGRDAPVQVDVDCFDIALTRSAAKLRGDLSNEQIAFFGKIVECGGEKNSDTAG